jgi:hypothetical protein
MELTIRSSSTDDHHDLLGVEIEPWGEELASADAIRAGFTRQPRPAAWDEGLAGDDMRHPSEN